MMYGYLDAGSPNPATITFSGLPSSISANYNVYVYIAGDSPGARTGNYTLNTASGTTTIVATQGSMLGNGASTYYQAGNGVAGNYIEFAGLSGGSFTLVASQGSARAPVDGIQIVQASPLAYWTGAQSGFWNTTDVNWQDANSNPTTYLDGQSAVVFNDTAGTSTVDIPATVTPNSVTFNNSVLNYTLQSNEGCGIAGTTGLIKLGTAGLTITATNNSFTGPVAIAGGTLAIPSIANGGVNSELGAGTSLVFNGGTLEYTGSDAAHHYRSQRHSLRSGYDPGG